MDAERKAAFIVCEQLIQMGLLKVNDYTPSETIVSEPMELDQSQQAPEPAMQFNPEETANLPFFLEESKGLFIHNWNVICKQSPKFATVVEGEGFKATVTVPIGNDQVSATHKQKKEAEKLASFLACKLLYERGLLRLPGQKEQKQTISPPPKASAFVYKKEPVEGEVLCKGCGTVLCKAADLSLGRHIEILASAWETEEIKSKFIVKPHAVKPGQLKIYCKNCEFDLGAVVAQTGTLFHYMCVNKQRKTMF